MSFLNQLVDWPVEDIQDHSHLLLNFSISRIAFLVSIGCMICKNIFSILEILPFLY